MMWRPSVFHLLRACGLWGLLGCSVPRAARLPAAPPLSEDLLRAQATEDCRFYRLQPSPSPSREEACIQSRIEAMQAIAAMQNEPDFAAAQQACAFFRGSPREDVCYRTRMWEQRMSLLELARTVLTQPRGVEPALPVESAAVGCGGVNGTYPCAPAPRRSTVMTRANPDGTVSYTAPHMMTSGPEPAPAFMPQTQTEIERARDAYNASLEEIKTNPTCADCRQKALSLGRTYKGMTREGGKVTIYDEAAIAKDINTAGGGETK